MKLKMWKILVMKRLREKIRIYNEDSLKSYSTSISFGISESSYHEEKKESYFSLLRRKQGQCFNL